MMWIFLAARSTRVCDSLEPFVNSVTCSTGTPGDDLQFVHSGRKHVYCIVRDNETERFAEGSGTHTLTHTYGAIGELSTRADGLSSSTYRWCSRVYLTRK